MKPGLQLSFTVLHLSSVAVQVQSSASHSHVHGCGTALSPRHRAALRHRRTHSPCSAAHQCRQHMPEIKARNAHANSRVSLLLRSQQAAENQIESLPSHSCLPTGTAGLEEETGTCWTKDSLGQSGTKPRTPTELAVTSSSALSPGSTDVATRSLQNSPPHNPEGIS